jgi:hypothetical protein
MQYSSTYECLAYMYPKVVPGGLVYVDDYWEFEVPLQEHTPLGSLKLIALASLPSYFLNSSSSIVALREHVPPCQACQRAVDDFRASARSAEPLMTVVEDGDYHFEPNLTPHQVQVHRDMHARGTAARHVDAVFWRKESS